MRAELLRLLAVVRSLYKLVVFCEWAGRARRGAVMMEIFTCTARNGR